LKICPSPIYIFDEIDRVLDSQTQMKFFAILKEISSVSQIIIASNRDLVIEHSNKLFGTMRGQDGTTEIFELFPY